MQMLPLERSRPSPFRVWDFFIAFLLANLIAFVAMFVLGFAAVMSVVMAEGAFDPETVLRALESILGSVPENVADFQLAPRAFWVAAYTTWVGMFIGIWAVGRMRRATLPDFGLPIEPRHARGALWGLAGYGGLVVYSLILSGLGVDAPVQGVAQAISDSSEPVTMVLAVLGAGVLAPLTEELLYRGVLQGALRRRLAPAPAILITSAIFAVSHYQAGTPIIALVGVILLPIFAISLLFGWLTERDDGSIGRAFFAHAAFNSLQVMLLFTGAVGV